MENVTTTAMPPTLARRHMQGSRLRRCQSPCTIHHSGGGPRQGRVPTRSPGGCRLEGRDRVFVLQGEPYIVKTFKQTVTGEGVYRERGRSCPRPFDAESISGDLIVLT